MDALIGIDLGTTGARATVYDTAYGVMGECYREYPLAYPGPGMVEQDAEQWWKLTAHTVRAALDACGRKVLPRGVAVSSQGISVVPVDGAFTPLCPAISWLDTRAGDELEEILGIYDAGALYRVTGKRASATYTLPKLLWLQRHRPALWQSAQYFLLPHDFLVAKMTGVACTDHTLAGGTMLYDIGARDWWGEALERLHIERDRLPALRWGGECAGGLTPQAAQFLGLPAGTPVAVGGQDQKCAALAAGIGTGIATVSMGTAAAVEMLDAPERGDSIPRFAWLAPGHTVSEGVVGTAGLALRWLRDGLLPHLSYRELDEMAERAVGESRVLFHPFLSGEDSPGWRAPTAGFHGLTLESTAADMACAVLEGVAFELRRNLEAMDSAAVGELRIFGGGAKSPLWCRIIAAVTGKTVRGMNTPEMACLGAALLAAQGCGLRAQQDVSPAGVRAAYPPDQALAAFYDSKYAEYLRVYRLGD